MKRLSLKHYNPTIHSSDHAPDGRILRYTIYLSGNEPESFKGKSAALDLLPDQLVNLRDRLNDLLEEKAEIDKT